MINDFLNIIPEGKYKGMRLYHEDKCGSEHVLPIEMYYLFQNALKNNYKVFFLSCKPIHNIEIPENDLNFIKKPLQFLKKNEELEYLTYNFSEKTLKIKDLQYKDILQIYTIGIKTDSIGSFFIYPELINDLYCFHLFIIVKNNFNLDVLLSLNFNIIKISSIIQHNENTITIKLMQKMYDLLNLQFKDYIIPFNEIEKTKPYDILKLPEKIELNNFYDKYFDFRKKNPNTNYNFFKIKIEELKLKLDIKECELWDDKLYKKLHFSKMCMHFYFFHEIILSDTVFFTNFIQLLDGFTIENIEGHGFNLDFDNLQYYSLIDMFVNDNYQLFSIFETVYTWSKK